MKKVKAVEIARDAACIALVLVCLVSILDSAIAQSNFGSVSP